MKKIFMFAAMASVALASCVKNEPVANVEQGDLITFNAPVVAPATKGQAAYTLGDFNVYAYSNPTTGYTGGGSVYIKDQKVSLTDGVWSAGKYYWPKNAYLNFVAYAPNSALTNGLSVVTEAQTKTDAGNLVLSYTVPENSQQDILYSEWALDQTAASNVTTSVGTAYTGVDIAFHHALAQVNFTIKGGPIAINDSRVKIQKVDLVGLNNVGTLTVAYTDDAEWTGLSGNATYNIWNTTAVLTENGTSAKFILLPQTLTANTKLVVTYQLPSDDTNGYTVYTVDVPLHTAKSGEDTIGAWEMEKNYIYTVIFDVDAIELAPVVKEDWTNVTMNNYEGLL